MSQGDTADEAKANIVDAIEACVSVLVADYLKWVGVVFMVGTTSGLAICFQCKANSI
jgi:hypothetical protein